jgi:hypothetical protein
MSFPTGDSDEEKAKRLSFLNVAVPVHQEFFNRLIEAYPRTDDNLLQMTKDDVAPILELFMLRTIGVRTTLSTAIAVYLRSHIGISHSHTISSTGNPFSQCTFSRKHRTHRRDHGQNHPQRRRSDQQNHCLSCWRIRP